MSVDNYYHRLLESEYEYDDEVGTRFYDRPAGCQFVHSDQDFFLVQHRRVGVGSSACSVADRPASSPAFYPDLEWYLPPPGAVRRSGTEAAYDDGDGDDGVRTRIDAWISRLDHLILDRPMNDVAEMTSSRATLTSVGSSSSTATEVADDEGRETAAAASRSPPRDPSLEEVPRATDQRRDYRLLSPGPPSLTVYRGAARNAEGEARLPVEYQTGTACSNIDEAYKILSTRYKLEDIAIDKKPIITWSKWNVSQIVRGPHEQSPIWNSSLQRRRYDRPNSIVFRELDREIDRRNKELEQIVEKKTELCRRFCLPSQNYSPASTSPTSSPPGSPQAPVACCSSAPPYLLPSPPPPPPSSSSCSSSPPFSSSCRLSVPVPGPSYSQAQNASVGSAGHRSSSEPDPAFSHLPVAMTTTTKEEEEEQKEEASHDLSPAAVGAGPGLGFGLIRKMVKSFWNIFAGGDGGGCHGDAKTSREASKGDEKTDSGQRKDPTSGK